MRRFTILIVLALAFMVGCAPRTVKKTGTLAELRDMKPDVQEAKVEQGLDQAMVHYRTLFEDLIEAREPARTERSRA